MANFDVALHLIGEQNIPNYIAIKHLDAEKHILLATEKTMPVAQRLARVLKESACVEIQIIEAFDIARLKAQFNALMATLTNLRVAANVTGGTKPMSILLVQALASISNAEIYYIETGAKKQMLSFSSEFVTPLKPCISDIATFVALQRDNPLSDEISTPSVLEYRLSKNLYSEHTRPNFRWLVDIFANLSNARGNHRFQEIKKEYEHFKAVLSGSQAEQDLASFYEELKGNLHKFCEFLGGKWFESYVYTQIIESKKLMKQVQGLRMNARLLSEDAKTKDRQELDLAYTDAYYLYIIECKSGNITQEDVQKLENNVRNYGGTYGRGVLIALQDQDETQMNLERIRNTQNIMLIDGKRVSQLATALQQWKPGRYMGN